MRPLPPVRGQTGVDAITTSTLPDDLAPSPSRASWTHLLVRPLVRPLLSIGATPNQVTTVRLLAGLISVALVASGTPRANLWGGIIWLVSALLDRLDGELARIGNLCSPLGQRYDYFVDTGLSAVFFIALGVGLRHSPMGVWAIALGAVACLGQLAASWMAEEYDKRAPSGEKVIGQMWGFDADDALYLLGPLVWLSVSVRSVAVVLAATGTLGFLVFFSFRLAQLKASLADKAASAVRP